MHESESTERDEGRGLIEEKEFWPALGPMPQDVWFADLGLSNAQLMGLLVDYHYNYWRLKRRLGEA